MVDKYLALSGGITQEVTGTVSGGTVGQAGKIPALDTSGRLDPTLMPVGVVADTASGVAAENLTAGNLVYINSSGEVARASAASGGNDAMGFVLSNVTSGQTALVYLEGRNTALSGLTPGTRYYLSDSSAGGVTDVPVTGTGKRHQFVGKAITATSLSFEADDSILLA